MIDITCEILKIEASWIGKGYKRVLIDRNTNIAIIKIDKSLLRP